MKAAVELSSVSIDYGSVRAVRDLSLSIPDRSLVTLLGPSGCGKTTTLRALAGLERISGGALSINQRVVDDARTGKLVPPDKRDVGMVFQNYGLWPHLTARENIAYPLRIARFGKDAIRERVAELAARMQLEKYLDKYPGRLSGGQQQRVAVARALSRRPSVLLFDEPLSNLDARLRRSLRDQIRDIHIQFGMTSVYVTHDHEEALAISDYVAVMLNGELVQFGEPAEVFSNPCSLAVAEFMGFDNRYPVDIDSSTAGRIARVRGTDWVVPVPEDLGPSDGADYMMVFRRDQLHVVPADDPRPLVHPVVERSRYLGDRTEVTVRHGGVTIEATVDDWTIHRLGLTIPQVGDVLPMLLATDRVRFLPADRPETHVSERE